MMQYLAFSLYLLALLTQAATVVVCLLAYQYTVRYRTGWIALSLGLILMLGRRLGPLWSLMQGHPFDHALLDSVLSLVVSVFLLIGLITVRYALKDLNQKNNQLEILNRYDSLTQALSRAEILRQGELEIARSLRTRMPIAVIELDIDHFKKINDQYGHAVGDEILKGLTLCCQSGLRANDFFGRIGGEEFVILLPETSIGRAIDAAERVRAAVEEKVFQTSANALIKISISLGVSIFDPQIGVHQPNHHALFREQLERADKAMYQAKNSGRNCVQIWNQAELAED